MRVLDPDSSDRSQNFGIWKADNLSSFVRAGNVVIGMYTADCTVNVVSYGNSTFRQHLRCYRELFVIDLINNILDFVSLCLL